MQTARRLPKIVSAVVTCVSIALASPASAASGFEAMIKDGRFADVKGQLEDYTKTHTDSWQTFYQLGYVDFRLHHIQSSVAALCKSILLKKDFAESHKILAFDLNILGHPDLAMHELEVAIGYDPSSFESHYELGRIDYEQGLYGSAVSELEKAKALQPADVRGYENLGLAYAALGNDAAAVESFEKALLLNQGNTHPSAWPLIDYATYLNQQEEYERARGLLLRAIAFDNSWDQTYEQLSKALRGLDRPAEAIEAMKHAIALNPKKPEFHYALAHLYRQLRRDADAKTELNEYERARAGISR